MTVEPPFTPNYLYERVDPIGIAPPPPRCSLDMRLQTEDGQIVNDNKLRLESFQGHEGINQLFEFQLELRGNDYTSSGPPDDAPWGASLKANNELAETLNFDNMISANLTIRLGLPETERDVDASSYPEDRPVALFNGIVTNFAMADRGVYHATIKPALFRLSLQSHYRLFSQQTILDVIKTVLSENKVAFTVEPLQADTGRSESANPTSSRASIVSGLANYRKQDWLQAGESDLDFINRLMQKVSLYYYFVHEDSNHLMVITDQNYYQPIYQRALSSSGHMQLTDQIKPLYLSHTTAPGFDRDDYIQSYKFQQNLTTSGISTVLAQKEATWESQQTAQVSPVFQNLSHQSHQLNMEQMHLVQYGASEHEVNALTNSAVRKLVAGKCELSGSTNCPELKPGYIFEVKETYQDQAGATHSSPLPVRPEIAERQYVATSVQHKGDATGSYHNQFSAVDAAGIATPFTPGQANQGSILALVTDKPEQASTDLTISTRLKALAKRLLNTRWTQEGSPDKYLKKDTFAYDNKDFRFRAEAGHGNSGNDQKYSCRGLYVRFVDEPSTSIPHWVKLAEHMQTVPEIGSYVVVGRSNDDNEIPEVQQSLQAKGSKVIMPDDYTTNTNVGDSYNTSYGNSTRVSFGADVATKLATATAIVEPKRQTENYNDVTYGESSSYGYHVSPRSHSVSMTGTGAPPSDADPDGKNMMDYVQYSRALTRGNTYGKSEQQGDSENHSVHIGDSESHSEVTGNSESYSNITGNTLSDSNHMGESKNLSKVISSHNESLVLTSFNQSATGIADAISTTGVTSQQSMTGASDSLVITGMSSHAGVTGLSSQISATGASYGIGVTGSSNQISATGESIQISATGISTSISTLGMSNSAALTGASNHMGTTGVSSATSVTGASDNTSVTGTSSQLSATGSASSISATGTSTSVSATGSSTNISVTGDSTSIDMIGGGLKFAIDNRFDLNQYLAQFEMASTIKSVM